jgi:hypothetical protein
MLDLSSGVRARQEAESGLTGMSIFWGLHRLFLDAQIAFGIKLVQWSLELTSE